MAIIAYEHFEVEHCGDVTVLHLVDAAHFNDFSRFHGELLEFLEEESPEKLLINFHRISYCSSAVFSGLLRVANRLESKLVLCGMNEIIREGFRTLKLEGTIFDMYNTVEEGVESLQTESARKLPR